MKINIRNISPDPFDPNRSLPDPLDMAKASCETMMRKFAAPDLPPRQEFCYHAGVFLSGMHHVWKLCGDDRYMEYIRDWAEAATREDGSVIHYDPGRLDDIQPGILFYPLLDFYRKKRYRATLDLLMGDIERYPRNEDGGFWHMSCLPHQMWLDGLYMGGPVVLEYARRFHRPDLAAMMVTEVKRMKEHCEVREKGLWKHAWDESRKAPWADPVTDRSPEFWGRAMGWVPVAILDDCEQLPAESEDTRWLENTVAELLTGICRYQSEEGRWYQVLDKGGQAGNWLENSCSCLFVSALYKAVRMGILPAEYADCARRGYEGVVRSLEYDGDRLLVGHVCIGTGVGDYRHYCERPVSTNDLHGVGAFLLMCAEAERYRRERNA